MVKLKKGEVDIHGKVYRTVALRVNEFRTTKQFEGWSLETSIIELDNTKAVVRCVVRNEKDRIVGSGLAEEYRTSGKINRTSALENCETSAIGRALASIGLGGEEYASANEVQGAIVQQKPATKVQQAAVQALLDSNTISEAHLVSVFGHSDVSKLLNIEAERILTAVNAAIQEKK